MLHFFKRKKIKAPSDAGLYYFTDPRQLPDNSKGLAFHTNLGTPLFSYRGAGRNPVGSLDVLPGQQIRHSKKVVVSGVAGSQSGTLYSQPLQSPELPKGEI